MLDLQDQIEAGDRVVVSSREGADFPVWFGTQFGGPHEDLKTVLEIVAYCCHDESSLPDVNERVVITRGDKVVFDHDLTQERRLGVDY